MDKDTNHGTSDVLTQPVLNTPYEHPAFHWELDKDTLRALNNRLSGRRDSGAYLPVPKDIPDSSLLQLDDSRACLPHTMINEIRTYVEEWRASGWQGANRHTRDLLEYWNGEEVFPKPFFCQVEAIETVVWLQEAGKRFAPHNWKRITDQLNEINTRWNEGIARIAFKMATGTGKTKLMQMLIAWVAVNEEHGAEFLAITPGLTVKERLEELKPSANDSFSGLLPYHLRERINRVKVSVLNYQSFRKRDKLAIAGVNDKLSGTGKNLLTRGSKTSLDNWKETDNEMLYRLLRAPQKRKIIVLNDEAHHCYFLSHTQGSDSEEKTYERNVAVWFNALRSLRKTRRLGMVYDFSATPMYLRVPSELSSEIFPWTVTDYPLIEAIEAGLTKIPRVPVQDDSDNANPLYRNIYNYTKPNRLLLGDMPTEVTSLLEQMHLHYSEDAKAYDKANMKPVMIVVANSIKNATTLYSHIAGYHDGEKWVPGIYEQFSNVEEDGSGPRSNPPTLLVHSELDAPDELSSQTVNVLAKEAEIHTPDAKSKTERIMRIRQIFNTVGKTGEPGEHIRCVVSVSMLTEGWDTKTVSHIFGYRKFGTQLLCEQVAGRGLRRTSFDCQDEHGRLPPEMVNIFGVPFNFMNATHEPVKPPLEPYRVYSISERAEKRRIVFPYIVSYRLATQGNELIFDPEKVKEYIVEPEKVPSMTEIMGLTGQGETTELIEKRRKHILFTLAAGLLKEFDDIDMRRRELFLSALNSVKAWLDHPLVDCPDWRLLLVTPHITRVPKEIAHCCVKHGAEGPTIVPVFADQVDPTLLRALDTGDIDFLTTKRLYHDTEKSELNRAPCDSRPEVKVAKALDEIPGIVAWARNFRLGWKIPYFDPNMGLWKNYIPDFVAKLEKKSENNGPVHLVIEYKGQVGKDSDMKTDAITKWWLPAVNGSNDPCCAGEWRYVFIASEDAIYPKIMEEVRN